MVLIISPIILVLNGIVRLTYLKLGVKELQVSETWVRPCKSHNYVLITVGLDDNVVENNSLLKNYFWDIYII